MRFLPIHIKVQFYTAEREFNTDNKSNIIGIFQEFVLKLYGRLIFIVELVAQTLTPIEWLRVAQAKPPSSVKKGKKKFFNLISK